MRAKKKLPTFYNFHDDTLNEFFATARERYRMLLKRLEGYWPVTEDPIFQQGHFCNVFREDDKTTAWIRENVREPMRNSVDVLRAMVLCRFVNHIDNLKLLHDDGLFAAWDPDKARERLRGLKPVVSGAYVVKTPHGLNKADGVVSIVEMVDKHAHDIITCTRPGTTTLQHTWEMLRSIPDGYLGPFMAYEVVTDLRHTWMLDRAPDINSWANPGPGACKGLSWLAFKRTDLILPTPTRVESAVIPTMHKLLALSQSPEAGLWPQDWPQWELREVEHWLCEYAKYIRIKYLDGKTKRRYKNAPVHSNV